MNDTIYVGGFVEMCPAISVVIPVYNGAQFLAETIQSILDQTFGDFELLLINDGSTDESPTILNKYTDPRIRVVHQENVGLVETLKKGISLASADLVARLDQDDISKPQRLAHQFDAMKRYELDVLYTQVEKFGGKNSWDNRERQTEHVGEVVFLKPLEYG